MTGNHAGHKQAFIEPLEYDGILESMETVNSGSPLNSLCDGKADCSGGICTHHRQLWYTN